MTEQTNDTAPAPAQQRALTPIQTVSAMLDTPEMRDKLEGALPNGISVPRFKTSAMAFLARPEAAYIVEKCDRASLYGAIMHTATLGLDLNPILGQVAIVPRGGKATVSVQYKGWITLALAHPAIAAVNVGIIYANDEYEVVEGTEPRLIVKPKLGERGEPIAFYAITHWTGGVPTFEVRTKAEVEAHRNKYSEAWKAGGKAAAIWKEHFSAMAMKTVLHMEKRKWPIKVDGIADEDDVIDLPATAIRDVTPGDGAVVEHSPAPRGRGSRLAAFAAE